MVDYYPDDVVSTAQAQVDMIRAYAPIVVDRTYSIVVRGRTYSYVGQVADTPADVSAGLAAELLEGQTVLAVLVDDQDCFVAGPVGTPYAISSPNDPSELEILPVQEAKAAVSPAVGRLVVIRASPFWTKDRDHPEGYQKVTLTVRREVEGIVNEPGYPQLGSTSPVLDIDASEVRTILSRASTGPLSIFESVVLPE